MRIHKKLEKFFDKLSPETYNVINNFFNKIKPNSTKQKLIKEINSSNQKIGSVKQYSSSKLIDKINNIKPEVINKLIKLKNDKKIKVKKNENVKYFWTLNIITAVISIVLTQSFIEYMESLNLDK